MTPTNPHTFSAAAVLAACAALLAHVPESFRLVAFVAVWFVALDTLTGVVTALVCREASSHKLRTKLVSKAVQYAILGGLAAGMSALTGTWVFVISAAGAVIGIEAMSMLENLAKLQTHGGVSLGPANKLIEMLSHFFSVTTPTPAASPNTVIPGPDDARPQDKNQDKKEATGENPSA